MNTQIIHYQDQHLQDQGTIYPNHQLPHHLDKYLQASGEHLSSIHKQVPHNCPLEDSK